MKYFLSVQVKNAETMMTRASLGMDGVRVTFADGKAGTVPFRELGGMRAEGIIALDLPHPYALSLHTAGGETIEIPWDHARAYCDATYDAAVIQEAKKSRRTLGTRLKDLREQLGLKQEELATKVNLDRGTISRIENGEQSPRLETLERIARGLGRPVEELLV